MNIVEHLESKEPGVGGDQKGAKKDITHCFTAVKLNLLMQL